MKRLVVWTKNARAEFFNILNYITTENPDAAERIDSGIDSAANSLADFATGKAGRVTGTYEKVLHNLPYILAYQISSQNKGADMIVILHVMHTARHWPDETWPKD